MVRYMDLPDMAREFLTYLNRMLLIINPNVCPVRVDCRLQLVGFQESSCDLSGSEGPG